MMQWMFFSVRTARNEKRGVGAELRPVDTIRLQEVDIPCHPNAADPILKVVGPVDQYRVEIYRKANHRPGVYEADKDAGKMHRSA
jgi:hypothetical protein